MRAKDAATNEYLKDPKYVADMVNDFVFQGQQLWQAEDVKELGERITRITSGACDERRGGPLSPAVERAADFHKEKNDLTGAERLSGFAKEEKLTSIATICRETRINRALQSMYRKIRRYLQK